MEVLRTHFLLGHQQMNNLGLRTGTKVGFYKGTDILYSGDQIRMVLVLLVSTAYFYFALVLKRLHPMLSKLLSRIIWLLIEIC